MNRDEKKPADIKLEEHSTKRTNAGPREGLQGVCVKMIPLGTMYIVPLALGHGRHGLAVSGTKMNINAAVRIDTSLQKLP
jgi:hypothetical protein